MGQATSPHTQKFGHSPGSQFWRAKSAYHLHHTRRHLKPLSGYFGEPCACTTAWTARALASTTHHGMPAQRQGWPPHFHKYGLRNPEATSYHLDQCPHAKYSDLEPDRCHTDHWYCDWAFFWKSATRNHATFDPDRLWHSASPIRFRHVFYLKTYANAPCLRRPLLRPNKDSHHYLSLCDECILGELVVFHT